eukprot:7935747-Lingulodinium_polyedra.AAC.1
MMGREPPRPGQRPVQAQHIVDALVAAAAPAERAGWGAVRWDDPQAVADLLAAAEECLREATNEA